MKVVGLLPFLLLLIACGNGSREDSDTVDPVIFDANLYSELFTISHEQGYKVISLMNPWQGSGNISLEYYIASFPDSVPADADKSNIIISPVEKVVCLSTTHVAMIDKLDRCESIIGISGTGYVSNINVRKRIEEGLVKEIGYDNNLNNELIVSLEPDVVLAYGIGPESAGYVSKLREAGIPVLFISDYLETDPLARAEWLRIFGLLYELEEEAGRFIENIAGQYEVLKQSISSRITDRPVVMAGLPYRDTWFVSPGNSYLSKIIDDAGGEYLWKDEQSDISMPLGLETVYVKSLKADIWINTGSALYINDILSVDKRLGNLPPVRSGMVFNNMKRLNATGGNLYWESGVLEPHVILRDIASIFHPELFPGYDPCYYIRLKERANEY